MSMTPDPTDEAERVYRALLLETLRPCPELPRYQREAKRKADREQQQQLEDMTAATEERRAV